MEFIFRHGVKREVRSWREQWGGGDAAVRT